MAWTAWRTCPVPAVRRLSPPLVAMEAVKRACERPEERGRSLSQWDSAETARGLGGDGVVTSISAETVRRILAHHKLKPGRTHAWLSSKVPRDAAFGRQVREIVDLYARPLAPRERVLCLDEMTSLQPRPRRSPTRPAQPDRPVQVEQWFSILQRKRLRIIDFPSKEALADRLTAFIAHWNVRAHPFNWSTKSVAKVMAACPKDDTTDRQEAA